MRVADHISELGSGVEGGEVVQIRYTDPIFQGSGFIKLWWNATAQKWFGKPRMCINGVDGGFSKGMGVDGDWSYLGASTTIGKWGLRAIPAANLLYAAGLQLQDRMQMRMLPAVNINMWVSPWFYDYSSDNTSRILFSNDRSAQVGFTWAGHADLGFEPSAENVGHGVVVKSSIVDAIGNQARFYNAGQYDDGITTSPYHTLTRNAGWDYVKLYVASQPVGAALGGVPTSAVYVPQKYWLYPTLYGFGATGGGGAAAIWWQYRWAS